MTHIDITIAQDHVTRLWRMTARKGDAVLRDIYTAKHSDAVAEGNAAFIEFQALGEDVTQMLVENGP